MLKKSSRNYYHILCERVSYGQNKSLEIYQEMESLIFLTDKIPLNLGTQKSIISNLVP